MGGAVTNPLGLLAGVLCGLAAGGSSAQCPVLAPVTSLVPAQRGPACAAAWEVSGTSLAGRRPSAAWRLVCEDGDPFCDTDGVANGACRLAVNVCVEQSLEGCTSAGVRSLRIPPAIRRRLAGLVLPAVPPAGPACGTAGTLTVPIRSRPGRRMADVTLGMKFRSSAGNGRNLMNVKCLPAAAAVCPSRGAPGLPNVVRLGIAATGSDLDLGLPPNHASAALPGGAALAFCVSGCDASTRPRCSGVGTAGSGTLNGATFGPPQPIVGPGVGLCLVHRYACPLITGTFDLDTGGAEIMLSLASDVYLSGDTAEPCPRCESERGVGSIGHCSSSAQLPGASCRVEAQEAVPGQAAAGNYKLSSACPPAGVPNMTLALDVPLTTGASSLPVGPRPCPEQTVDIGCGGGSCNAACTGSACVALDAEGRCVTASGGIGQECCSNATATECFPADRAITRTGVPAVPQPAWPAPADQRTATGMVLAGTFCARSTGLPLFPGAPNPAGPGTLTLPVESLIVQ